MKKSLRRRRITNKRAWLKLAREAKFSAANMAALSGITLRQLERHAQKVLGCTPQIWLDEQRMVAAQVLLLDTDTVKEVALELGYTQASHFCRQFKAYYEMTPTRYIALCEKRNGSPGDT
jgi:AraC-like DNA-binding protein